MASDDSPHGTGGDDDQDRSGTERENGANPPRSEVLRQYREVERRQASADATFRSVRQDQIEDQAVRDLLARAGWVADNEHDQREFGELMDWLRGLKKGDFNTLLVWARDAKARMDAEKAAHDRLVARGSVFLAGLGGGIFMSGVAFFLPAWWDVVSRWWAAIRRAL